MKTKAKLSDEIIQETLDGVSEGLKPLIDNFDAAKLSKEDSMDIIKQLDELEALALKIKEK